VDSPKEPSPKFPIAQSYVDVVLDGALEYGREFAEEVVRTTGNWRDSDVRLVVSLFSFACPYMCSASAQKSVHWEDDRATPRIYNRRFLDDARKSVVDALLNVVIPNELGQRKRVASI